jgi:hypothetical protein
MSGPYHIWAIAFDMDGRTEGDLQDLLRFIHNIEAEYPGAHLLGSDMTRGWPSYRVHEAAATYKGDNK